MKSTLIILFPSSDWFQRLRSRL